MRQPSTRTSTEETDLEIDGVDYCVTYTRTVEWSRERYGADADGNRGMLTTFTDVDITLTNVDRYDEDGMTTLPLADLDPALRDAIAEKLAARPLDDGDDADAAFDAYMDRLMDEKEDR